MAELVTPTPAMPAPVPVGPVYAGLVTRTVAFVIDVLLMAMIALIATVCGGLILSALLPHKLSPTFLAVFLTATAWLVWSSLYLVGFWVLVGQTPGMRLLRIEVLAGNGRRPGLVRALVRLVGLTLAAIPLGLGYAMILVDRRRRGLQDYLAGTVVVHAPERRLGSGWS